MISERGKISIRSDIDLTVEAENHKDAMRILKETAELITDDKIKEMLLNCKNIKIEKVNTNVRTMDMERKMAR